MAGLQNAVDQTDAGVARIVATSVHEGRNIHGTRPVVALTVEPAALAGLVGRVAVDLQRRAGAELEDGAVAVHGAEVAYPCVDPKAGLAAGELALMLVEHVHTGPEVVAAIDRYVAFGEDRHPPVQEAAVIRAAQARGIPVFRVRKRVLQLGHGRHQQRLRGSQTSYTSNISRKLAQNKADANRVLHRVGLPVVPQKVVRSADEAVEAAERIGFPVAVKPNKGSLGRGASVRLTDADQVAAAYQRAGRYGSVLVQEYIPGSDHRMLVIGGELVAVAKRVPARVTGDGVQTVEELVHEANRDPRRGQGHRGLLSALRLDERTDRVLAERGYTLATVPPAGETVYLCDVANVSAGGTAVDVTDEVHPDNRAMAVRAGMAVGLDVVGVDFLTEDIGRSYREVGGAICEINSNPELRMHLWPAEGRGRDAISPVLDLLFPPGAPSRIPVAAIAGNRGKKATERLLGHMLEAAGRTVGVADRDDVRLCGQVVREGPLGPATAAATVLLDPTADAAVLGSSPGRLLSRGLGIDACDVGALLDHTAAADLGSAPDAQRLDAAQRLVLDAATTLAVVNADEDRCLALAEGVATPLCLVSSRPDHARVRDHVAAGGCAAVLDDGAVVLHDGGCEAARLAVPADVPERAALFATALAHGLGTGEDAIRAGLERAAAV